MKILLIGRYYGHFVVEAQEGLFGFKTIDFVVVCSFETTYKLWSSFGDDYTQKIFMIKKRANQNQATNCYSHLRLSYFS